MELPAGATAPLISPPNGLTGFLIRVKCDKDGVVVGKDFKGNPIAHQPSYAIGQTTYPITGHAVGQLTFLVVFFQPMGMYQLFGYNTDAITNKSVDLLDFLGQKIGERLIAELVLADDREQQLEILNSFFLNRIPIEDNCGDLKKVLVLIHESQGGISIIKIADSSGINRRTLERHFHKRVGISPKVYVQIIRFKNAMNYLQANPNITWTELTYNNGFFDQAHMIRYFKEYLKVSPNNLVKIDLDFINYLLKH
ncbi:MULTISPECIES: AraC family transcriptional regulator [unclassified Mucilaginibacter]|nr:MULTISPECIES: AraC family transcriptional regulator [unclassified Mucilaginibacter]MEB0260297.1 AraC family transcriptional regulator [Mucilaginibacter sp. 10I4]MEB0277292.1 AraC family transcriptional regulator [Mucilaginibacter sp. 10B2]MEB0302142.1 AraC family transcriptional regulator [Mucilaginibacter sp. 5C4]WPX25418.1 AraC family transcriptional regulator [Mucilaginibacter sp. 5C4]